MINSINEPVFRSIIQKKFGGRSFSKKKPLPRTKKSRLYRQTAIKVKGGAKRSKKTKSGESSSDWSDIAKKHLYSLPLISASPVRKRKNKKRSSKRHK